MLSSVLRNPRAVQTNISIMHAFVRLRAMLMSNADFARKLIALENRYDAQFRVVFDAIRELMEQPPSPPKPRIGFEPLIFRALIRCHQIPRENEQVAHRFNSAKRETTGSCLMPTWRVFGISTTASLRTGMS